MTYENYKEQLAKIEAYTLHKKSELIIAYCDANNPYKIGDIFEDHIGKIEIKKIRYSTKPLCCYYKGNVLNKNGTPSKKIKERVAYQSNDKYIERKTIPQQGDLIEVRNSEKGEWILKKFISFADGLVITPF